jgi:hypothetical protein
MNSHMTSFFDSTPNGGASITIAGPEEIYPEQRHEVPVQRCRAECRPDTRPAIGAKAVSYVEQADDAAEQMQRVQRGEDVEEGAARICRQIESLSGELPPGDELSEHEQRTKHQRAVDPRRGTPHGRRE